jgi:hypothetical protein
MRIALLVTGLAAAALPSGETRADDDGGERAADQAELDAVNGEIGGDQRAEPYDPFARGEGVAAAPSAPAAPAEPSEVAAPDTAETPLSPLPGDQELGVRVGAALGGRTTPGGFVMAGHYLYRLAGRDWFDGGVAFTFGSGREACFRDRRNEVICQHGFASGFAAEVLAGIARYFGEDDEPISPFLRGGLGVRLVAFPGDDLRGFAVPLWAGAGVRARVHDNVSVVGGAELRAGPAWMTRAIGLEPHGSFSMTVGVDFRID